MSLAIDYSALENNAFDFYDAPSNPAIDGLGSFDIPETFSLGMQSPASYLCVGYGNSMLAPSTLIGAAEIGKQNLLRELEGYASLQPGWDGYMAERANPDSIMDARVFISSLPLNRPYPTPMLAPDGEVSLFWEDDGLYLEASFPGDSSYHYIFNAPDLRVGGDDLPVSSPKIQQAFLSYLARF